MRIDGDIAYNRSACNRRTVELAQPRLISRCAHRTFYTVSIAQRESGNNMRGLNVYRERSDLFSERDNGVLYKEIAKKRILTYKPNINQSCNTLSHNRKQCGIAQWP
jgi:hypothetical protein